MDSGYLEKNTLINGRFKVELKLGKGATTVVYLGTDQLLKNHVAIKAESLVSQTIPYENNVYDRVCNTYGFAQIFYTGQERGQNIIVMELLGVSIKNVQEEIGKLCLKTVLELADQMLWRLQEFHKHFVHCDLKPGNFMMGSGSKSSILYLVDFEFARQNFYDQLHLNNVDQFVGHPLFAARNVHLHKPLTARDDLESLGYVLVYFITGTLPWVPVVTLPRDEQFKQLQRMKLCCSLDTLCQGVPSAFYEYFTYVLALEPHEEPNYSYLRQIFRILAARMGFIYNHVFEWNQ